MPSDADIDGLRAMLSNAVVGGRSIPEARDPYDLGIYHIGGDGGYGPVERVIEHFGSPCLPVIFDIRTDTDDRAPMVDPLTSRTRKLFVNVGVSGKTGKSPFRINVCALAPRPIAVRPPAIGWGGSFARALLLTLQPQSRRSET